MFISIKKDKVIVNLQYDGAVHALLMTVPTRNFNKKTLTWSFSMMYLEYIVKMLVPMGFEYTQQVIDCYKIQARHSKKLNTIKAGALTEIQLSKIAETNLPFYEYQKIGTAFVTASKYCLLCDQPGLGKTLQTIGAMMLSGSTKILVLCPKSVKLGWYEELARWAPHYNVIVVDGTAKQRAAMWKDKSAQVYIANYQLLLHDFDLINETEWDMIAADEATVVSNPDAKTTEALKKLTAHRRIAMTGTPLSNRVEDLWSLVDWVCPGLLGNYYSFVQTYCDKDRFGNVKGYKNLSQLRNFIEPVMIRRRKKDVLTELPPKLYEKIIVELSPKERAIYKSVEEIIVQELMAEGISSRALSSKFVRNIRLQQAANAVQLITNIPHKSSKIEELKRLVDLLTANEEKVLIFTKYRTVAELLAIELEKYQPLQITGAVNETDRAANRHLFTDSPAHNIMILTSAGNMGLNLQAASSVIHFDLPWSIAQLEQREDRAHRNGQTKNVTVYKLIAANTIDELMLTIINSKRALSDEMLEDNVELVAHVEVEKYISANVHIDDSML